jgi:hypothetical protein
MCQYFHPLGFHVVRPLQSSTNYYEIVPQQHNSSSGVYLGQASSKWLVLEDFPYLWQVCS